ncbi:MULTISPECIES: acinetodin/klebsidin/J25 family lasso peptide [Cronobacter]|nr:acinetodin/klebsidin/J25 family lasso peptide [Cronobacter dublinensis]
MRVIFMESQKQSKPKFSVVTFNKSASKMTGGGSGPIQEYYMFPGLGGGHAPILQGRYG